MFSALLSRITLNSKALGYAMIANALIAIAIACNYFQYMSPPQDALTWFYLATATLGQMSLLTGLFSLLLLPLLFIKGQRLRNVLIALGLTIFIGWLITDVLVYAQYRFHINAVVIEMVLSGGVVTFPLVFVLTTSAIIALIFAVQWTVLKYTTLKAATWTNNVRRRFVAIVAIAIVSSHSIHVFANAHGVSSITNITRYLPLYHPTSANRLLTKYDLVDSEFVAQQRQIKASAKNVHSPLNYPRSAMQVSEVSNKKDILWIVVDSWRQDSFTAQYMPNLHRFAEQGCQLDNHYSTGNATRVGIFGLFYALPGTYWHAFYNNRRSPLFMDRLQQLDYKIGVFASAHLRNPQFDQTVFSNIENLRIESKGEDVISRDREITEEWVAWNNQRDKKEAAFSFLFYDTPHAYAVPEDYKHKFEPMSPDFNYLKLNNNSDVEPYLNRYYTSAHYTDSLIAGVIESLRKSGKLENTIVVITGDHGQEINDNKQNFWGHNGNFTDAQLKVPFAIVGSDNSMCQRWNKRQTITSHIDIVPSLMNKYLGVANELVDYTTGENLFAPVKVRPWLLAASYSKYAIIEQDSITEVNAGTGGFEYLDKSNRSKEGKVNSLYLQQVFHRMQRFSK
ncbi:MAG: DUF3413 domain-containing protein [Psychrobium sp.]|nr:DUF3413 domain-containing protein [Psychrobium sp.]